MSEEFYEESTYTHDDEAQTILAEIRRLRKRNTIFISVLGVMILAISFLGYGFYEKKKDAEASAAFEQYYNSIQAQDSSGSSSGGCGGQ